MSRRGHIVWIVAGLTVAAALVAFALLNRGNPVTLRFAVATWRGEAVYAIYAALFLGLFLMFLIGLPSDLAARREAERLERRVLGAEEREPRPVARSDAAP